MIKDHIAKRFDRAAPTYDAVAQVQHAAARRLIAHLRTHLPKSWAPNTVLDVGTGTGYMIDALHPLFPSATYTLNDIAPAMLEYCQHKFAPHAFQYCAGDIESLAISRYDLIVSNFALQWASNLPQVLQKLYDYSQVLAYTCMLEGTFSSWYDALEAYGISQPHYPTLQNVQQTVSGLSSTQSWVTSQRFSLTFSQGSEFMRYLQRLGASASTGLHTSARARPLLSFGPIEVDYHVAYCILIKE